MNLCRYLHFQRARPRVKEGTVKSGFFTFQLELSGALPIKLDMEIRRKREKDREMKESMVGWRRKAQNEEQRERQREREKEVPRWVPSRLFFVIRFKATKLDLKFLQLLLFTSFSFRWMYRYVNFSFNIRWKPRKQSRNGRTSPGYPGTGAALDCVILRNDLSGTCCISENNPWVIKSLDRRTPCHGRGTTLSYIRASDHLCVIKTNGTKYPGILQKYVKTLWSGCFSFDGDWHPLAGMLGRWNQSKKKRLITSFGVRERTWRGRCRR